MSSSTKVPLNNENTQKNRSKKQRENDPTQTRIPCCVRVFTIVYLQNRAGKIWVNQPVVSGSRPAQASHSPETIEMLQRRWCFHDGTNIYDGHISPPFLQG